MAVPARLIAQDAEDKISGLFRQCASRPALGTKTVAKMHINLA